MERAMIKKAVARSAGFLLRSLIGALVIYLVITAVVLSAGLVSLWSRPVKWCKSASSC